MTTNGYNRSQSKDQARVIILMPEAQATAIDAWAVPAGYPSRTAAIRHLLALGLEIVTREPVV